MAARPALAAFSCNSCRQALLRAVVSSSSTISSPLRLQAFAQRSSLRSTCERAFSSCRTLRLSSVHDEGATPQAEAKEESNRTDEQDEELDAPWYLEEAPPQHPTTQHQVTLPKAPEDAPEIIEPMIKYIFEDMGLDDISVLDLRGLEHPAALGSNLIMLFGTARSERHLHVSAGRFVRWLRRNKADNPRADGLIGAGELKTKLRRLRKKAKLMGTNTAIVPGGDNGISTGWVCVNFTTADTAGGESVSHDEGGRLSGFGTAQNGTTVVIQCMTESRRSELDLESLWTGILKRSLVQSQKVKGEATPDANDLEKMVASKLHISTSPSELQWQAMKRASQQHRYFSTSARRLVSSRFKDLNPLEEEEESGTPIDEPARTRVKKSRPKRSRVPSDDQPQNLVPEEKSHMQLVLEKAWFATNPGPRKLTPEEDDDEDADWDLGPTNTPRQFHDLVEKLRKLPLAENVAAKELLKRPRYSQYVPGDNLDDAQSGDNTGTTANNTTMGLGEGIQLSKIREEIERIQMSGISVEEDALFRLVSWIWVAEPLDSNTVKDRLVLVDEALQTIQERGIQAWSSGRIIELICGVMNSPLYGPELQAVQQSLEYLLDRTKSPRTPERTLQLMQVYASKQDWDRFWDAFRAPARYMVSRTAEEYQFAYDVLTATQDSKMCVDALRWMFPQMLKEEPPVIPQGRLFESLKACILTADPAAESIMNHRPETNSLIAARQMEVREFVRVLERAQLLRDEAAGDAIRQLKDEMLRTSNPV